jgi:hypothetical protein
MKTYTRKPHSESLTELFPNADRSGEALVRFVRRLELKMNRLAVCYCNGYTREYTNTGHSLNWDFSRRESYWEWRENCRYDSTHWEADCNKALKLLTKVTGASGSLKDSLVINGDARGYTLKICKEYVEDNNMQIYTDLGGSGILAPFACNVTR